MRAASVVDPRCAGSSSEQAGQYGLYRLDAAAGYVMQSNLCVRLRTGEYDEVLRTNSRGLVGAEVPPTKSANEFRIVVLGDSYTVGGQVPYDQTFSGLLEQRLHQAGYPNVRVIDTGVGGYTTFNEAGYLHENLSWLQPDAVIVAAFLGNDVGENVLATRAGYEIDPDHPKGFTFGPAATEMVQDSLDWFPRNGRPLSTNLETYDPAKPVPTPVGNPDPSAFVSPTASSPVIPGWIWDSSPLTTGKNLVHWIWDGARLNSRLLGHIFGTPVDRSVSTAPGAEPPSKTQKLLNVTSFEWTILRSYPQAYWIDAAWPLFGNYLGDIRDSSAAAHAPALLLVIPQIAQFNDVERARTMADYRFSDSEVDWDRPQRELRARADAVGMPTLDLLPVFRARTDRAQLYLPLDQHFAALGHAVVAEQLANELLARGWLRH
jgi:lysophospholipase L1-like esterase